MPDNTDYEISRDLAIKKAKRHGESTWPFRQKKTYTMAVRAKEDKDGKVNTSVQKVKIKASER